MVKALYTTKEAETATGASRQAIRAYTAPYARYLSTDATPEAGKARKFTAADLKLIAYIRQCTKDQNYTHAETLQSLADGALDDFDWTLPEEPDSAQDAPQDATTALVPLAQLEAARLVMQDAQRREQEATAKVDQLQQRVEELTMQLGEAQGELSARKRRRPGWVVVLFGE